MRRPWVRMTTRRTMLVIASLALIIGGYRWLAATRGRYREYSGWAWRYEFLERAARSDADGRLRDDPYTAVKIR